MPPRTSSKKVKITINPSRKKKTTKPAVQVVTGRGDYRPTSFRRVRGNGDYLGDLIGGLGQKAGNAAQSLFRDLTGFGDYRSHGPKVNTLMSMVDRAADTRKANISGSSPSENPFEMGAMSVKFSGSAPRIQHREFVGPVYATGSTQFSTQVFRIQPGLIGTNTLFPWGSSVARCFRQYELRGMIIEYSTTSTNYASTSALGSVSMSTVYDAEQGPLSSLAEVDNNEFTTTAAPSTSFYHPIECAPDAGATQIKYVQLSNAVSGADARFDDVGIFQISLNGITAPAGTQLGQLFVSYDIEFLKAELPDLHVGTTALFSSITPSIPYSGTVSPNIQNSLPATTVSGSVINLPAGYNGSYVLNVDFQVVNGTNGIVSGALGSFGSDITPLPLYRTNTGATNSVLYAGDSSTQRSMSFAFSTIATSTGGNNSITTLFGSSIPGYFNISIIPLDNDLSTPLTAMYTGVRGARRGLRNSINAPIAWSRGIADAQLPASSSSSVSAPSPSEVAAAFSLTKLAASLHGGSACPATKPPTPPNTPDSPPGTSGDQEWVEFKIPPKVPVSIFSAPETPDIEDLTLPHVANDPSYLNYLRYMASGACRGTPPMPPSTL